MPNSKSPQSKPLSPLDELAKLLAKKPHELQEADAEHLEKQVKWLRVNVFSRKFGVPPQEAADLTQETIIQFLEEVHARPDASGIANGRYLRIIARNRFNDYLRHLHRHPSVEGFADASGDDEADEHAIERIPGYLSACHDAFNDRQGAQSLQMHAISVLRRLAATNGGHLLQGRFEKIVMTMPLVASQSDSADSAIHARAAVLLEQGVLGGKHTRNLRVRLDRQPELRRELSSPQRVPKATKSGSSSDE